MDSSFPSKPFTVISGVLASDLANTGTLVINYPTGYSKNNYIGAGDFSLMALQTKFTAPADFTVALGATAFTLTWARTTTVPAGSAFRFQADESSGNEELYAPANAGVYVSRNALVQIDLGSPYAGGATQVTTAQLLGAAGNLAIDGSKASGGSVTADVPRNFTLTVATTNQSGINFTVTGTDIYGNAMSEVLAGPNNNTVSGKKAFKKITQVAASAAIATNGVSVGLGNVLGLPIYVGGGRIVKELEDNAAATAGTFVAGLAPTTKSTTSTADVRGTYVPNSTPDGSKGFSLVCAVADPTFKGNPQA